jgi:hypothetical protein
MPSGVNILLVSGQLDGLVEQFAALVEPISWRLGSAWGKEGRARPDCDSFQFDTPKSSQFS